MGFSQFIPKQALPAITVSTFSTPSPVWVAIDIAKFHHVALVEHPNGRRRKSRELIQRLRGQSEHVRQPGMAWPLACEEGLQLKQRLDAWAFDVGVGADAVDEHAAQAAGSTPAPKSRRERRMRRWSDVH